MKLPSHLASLEQRPDGHYVVVTRDYCWGRGTTLHEACMNAKKAGARSFAKKNVVVAWQPDSAWKKLLPGRPGEAPPGPPYVSQGGAICCWGWQETPMEYLWTPEEKKG